MYILAIYSYMKAMEHGPLGLSFLFFSAGILLPIIFGIFYLNEPAPPVKFAGLALLFAAFAASTSGKGGKMSAKWVAWILLASAGNGILGICQKLGKEIVAEEATAFFLLLSFGQAAAISLVLAIVFIFVKKERVTGFATAPFVKVALLAAVTTCGGNYLMLVLSRDVTALVLYPVVSGSLVITSVLSSRLVFREKVTKRHVAAIAVGLAALVMLGL